jgi:hypothetical protein
MNSKVIGLIIAAVLFVFSSISFAQDRDDLKYGAGFQGSFPAYGLSGMMDINEQISVQAIIGFFGNLNTYAGRGLYRFKKEDQWELYGYGMVGAWSYDGVRVGTGPIFENYTETVLGFGAGAGIEYDWRALAPDLPPLFWNVELGIGVADFNEVDYNFNALLLGVGVHYRF